MWAGYSTKVTNTINRVCAVAAQHRTHAEAIKNNCSHQLHFAFASTSLRINFTSLHFTSLRINFTSLTALVVGWSAPPLVHLRWQVTILGPLGVGSLVEGVVDTRDAQAVGRRHSRAVVRFGLDGGARLASRWVRARCTVPAVAVAVAVAVAELLVDQVECCCGSGVQRLREACDRQ